MFQELLRTLAIIAAKHNVDVATVASRAILDKSQVAAVIVGATSTAHVARNARINELCLDAADAAALRALGLRRRGPDGDVYALERERGGRHGRIMKYNLHQKGSHATAGIE